MGPGHRHVQLPHDKSPRLSHPHARTPEATPASETTDNHVPARTRSSHVTSPAASQATITETGQLAGTKTETRPPSLRPDTLLIIDLANGPSGGQIDEKSAKCRVSKQRDVLIFADLGFLYCLTTLAPMISLNLVAFLHLVAELAACRNVDTAAGSYPELFAQMLVAWRLGTVATLSEMKKVPGRCWTHADRSSIGKPDKTVERSFENLQRWQREPPLRTVDSA
jgi:hypothetical protein